ncbi:MAG: 2-polyprenyl-3-methyl-5-hydroxy-6-metoxy-1,4-benzoquinol methylase/RimJ [Enterobacterales bacterium]|jgi:2-polyprenyl-3-methyl-5-hydroxy-6-metoxy-1,4-benzoquinol methylase/RimJ/RimL family protein N-acetyltransferase
MINNKQNDENTWDKTWSDPGAQAWYPDEQVVRFLSRYYVQKTGLSKNEKNWKAKPETEIKGLDLGCGKGRHVVTMAEQGIKSFGIDISEVAIQDAIKWIEHLKINADLISGTIEKLQYPDECFDLVICHGVLDHILVDVRVAAIEETWRILKPGGRFFVSLISETDSALGEGEIIEEMTWLIPNGYEAGMPQSFFNVDRINKELSDFQLESIVKVSNESFYGRSLIGTDKHYACDSRYYVTAIKPLHEMLSHNDYSSIKILLEPEETSYLSILDEGSVTDYYVDSMSDPDVIKWLVNVKLNPPSECDVKKYVVDNLTDPYSCLFGFYHKNELSGTVRIHDVNQVSGSAILGIVIFNKSIWGYGWGNKLLSKIGEYCFKNLKLKSIFASIDSENIYARKSFTDAGFIRCPSRDVEYGFGNATCFELIR